MPGVLLEQLMQRQLGVTGAVCGTLLLMLLLLSPGDAAAGGGPESTLVVVNGDSPLSLRIANEYVRLRDIPENNVLWLHGIPSTDRIPIALFREKIWQPISEFLRANKPDQEIDSIVYSADFPYAVDFAADLKTAGQPRNKYLGKTASLTSLTYFARRVASGDPGYLGKNHYFRDFAGPKKKPIQAPASSAKLNEKQAKALRKEAAAALKGKDYEKAIAGYREFLQSHPQSPQGWHDLARALAAAGKQAEALAAISNAVDGGWTNSLETRNDAYLKILEPLPEFGALIRRMESAFQPILLPHGFRNHYVWSNADLALWEENDFKDQYYLSTMLAFTGVRGNSFPEVMNYLASAAASDGSLPDGTVYLMENSNVRSKTRQNLFPTTLDELARRGGKGEILSKRTPGQNGIIPVGKVDIIGAVVGSRSFDWNKSNSRLLPGAIAESLTSYGGDFNNRSQTKLSEFLRQGAAGSSGAVAEPYSFQEKFPVPLVHSFYAEGCSLAEAFYQSIEYPYQLIVVGDPLARPFAHFAEITLGSPNPVQPWSGTVSIKPVVRMPDGSSVKTLELWVNGRRLSSAAAGEQIQLDTRLLADGAHQLRLVAVEDSRIETRSYARFDIRVSNSEATLSIDEVETGITYGDDIEISGGAATGSKVTLFQGHRRLGSAVSQNGKWKTIVPSTILGLGPVALRVESSRDGTAVRSAAIELEIKEADRQAAFGDIKPLNKGLSAVVQDTDGLTHKVTIERLSGVIKVPDKKRIKIDRLSLNGFFNVTRPGFYQLVVKADGQIQLSINDRLLLDRHITRTSAESILPLSLEAGWHKLQIELDASKQAYLKVLLSGDQVPALLEGDIIAH